MHVYRMGIAEKIHSFFGCAYVQNENREYFTHVFREIMCRKRDLTKSYTLYAKSYVEIRDLENYAYLTIKAYVESFQ